MAKKKLNVAMIGYAFMGRAHSNAWRQVSRFMNPPYEPVLKVVCGRSASKVKDAAETLGWQEHATDWRDVVNRKDVDIVDVSTPGDSHAEIAIAAAQAGKVVLCEKPLANTVSEARQMVAAVEAAGVVNMVCHNYRRAPAVALAKQLIEAGKLGTLYHYRGTYLQDWLVNPLVPRLWRMDKAQAGSGALGDILSHSLDLARHLVGEVREVAGMMKTFIDERPLPGSQDKAPVTVDDASLALVRFQEGAIGSIEGTRFATGRKNYNRFEINGSKGSVAFDMERMNELELYLEEGPLSGFRTINVTDPTHPFCAGWWPPGHILGYEHTFVHTFLDLLDGIAQGKSPKPDFRDGLRNQLVLEAIEASAASKGWVEVPA